MSAWMLFVTGLMVSLMCLAGLVFTIVEVRRLGREADERALSTANGAEGAAVGHPADSVIS